MSVYNHVFNCVFNLVVESSPIKVKFENISLKGMKFTLNILNYQYMSPAPCYMIHQRWKEHYCSFIFGKYSSFYCGSIYESKTFCWRLIYVLFPTGLHTHGLLIFCNSTCIVFSWTIGETHYWAYQSKQGKVSTLINHF